MTQAIDDKQFEQASKIVERFKRIINTEHVNNFIAVNIGLTFLIDTLLTIGEIEPCQTIKEIINLEIPKIIKNIESRKKEPEIIIK